MALHNTRGREGEQLAAGGAADFLDEIAEVRARAQSFLRGEQRPLAVLDLVEEMQHMPALGGDEFGNGFVGHGDINVVRLK